MLRSVRLYTPAQIEEALTLATSLAGHDDLQPAERDKLTAFQADLKQTVREDRRRSAGTARIRAAVS